MISTVKDTHPNLTELCKKGDNEAFKQLYELYFRAMFSISMRILNNKDEAEDVLQDSFVSAFLNMNQYHGTATFGSWLKRIVINKSIDAVKKLKIELVPLDDIEVTEETTDEEDIFYDVEELKNGIQQLPDGYRIILTLYLFEDYSHKMIAEQLKISEGTSKSQYSRARKKLIAFLTQKKQHNER